MTAIAERREPKFDNKDDALFYRFCTEILENHFVSDETFEQARERFGDEQLVDIIGVLGNSSLLSMCLTTFEVDLPEGVEAPFPDLAARTD